LKNVTFSPVSNEWRGSIPPKLYRRFSCREHAENFRTQGEVFFRPLATYQGIEDRYRRDQDEGSSWFDLARQKVRIGLEGEDIEDSINVTNGKLTFRLENPQRYWISCYSSELHEHQKKFGKWLVTIHEPEIFLSRIAEMFPSRECLFWGNVRYYDPQKHVLPPVGAELWRRKIDLFSDEKEFRLGVYFGLEQNVSEATLQAPVVQMANFSTLAEDP